MQESGGATESARPRSFVSSDGWWLDASEAPRAGHAPSALNVGSLGMGKL
jgi:hypothetical protein